MENYCRFKSEYIFLKFLKQYIYCAKYWVVLFNFRCGLLDINIEDGRLSNMFNIVRIRILKTVLY